MTPKEAQMSLVTDVEVAVATARRYAKFVVAAVGTAVTLGVLDPGLAQTIVGVLTAVGVYRVRNK